MIVPVHIYDCVHVNAVPKHGHMVVYVCCYTQAVSEQGHMLTHICVLTCMKIPSPDVYVCASYACGHLCSSEHEWSYISDMCVFTCVLFLIMGICWVGGKLVRLFLKLVIDEGRPSPL